MVMIFLQSPCLWLWSATDWCSSPFLSSPYCTFLPVDIQVFYIVVSVYVIFSCRSVWFWVWSLLVLMCFCFCWSLGCALDCCPLSWRCPLDPKAVWLPLQATVPMATFHSHFFSIWLWHIHVNIKTTNTVNLVTTPCTNSEWKDTKYGKILQEANVDSFYLNSIGFVWYYGLQMCEVYMPNHSICVSGGSCWI